MDVVSLGYRTDLAMLALGGSLVDDRGDHLVVRSPHNPGHWWGNFLLLPSVPADPAAWVDRFHAEIPDARHVAIGFDGVSGSAADLACFAELGLRGEAAAVMTAASVHPPARPNLDAELRALASDEDWRQSVELRVRSREDDEDPAAFRVYAEASAETNRQRVEAGHGAWFGAFLEGRLVAQMGLFRASPGLARFQAVETDPAYRNRGLCGTLVHHVSRYGFDVLGAQTLVMVADPTYSAIRIYRAIGFTETETQLQVERPPT